jgi:hypothetical protein
MQIALILLLFGCLLRLLQWHKLLVDLRVTAFARFACVELNGVGCLLIEFGLVFLQSFATRDLLLLILISFLL